MVANIAGMLSFRKLPGTPRIHYPNHSPPGSLQCAHSLVFTHPYQPFPVHSPLEARCAGVNVAATLGEKLGSKTLLSVVPVSVNIKKLKEISHGTPMVCPEPQSAWLCCY